MANAIGYDVSDFQDSIPADAQYVFVKATEGGHTEQSGYSAKVAAARARGLPLGHYHFIHCENPVDQEVEHFCRVVGQVPASDLLALDFEPYGQGVSDAACTAAKNQWLAAVKQRYPNNQVGMYVNLDWWHRTDDDCGDFLWVADPAHPAGQPAVQHPWRFHQYVQSPLDADVFNGSVADLQAWVGDATSTPAPVSVPSQTGPWVSPGRVTRDQWGAVAPSGAYTPMTNAAGVKIHYLGSAYTFGDHSTCAAYIRRIQASHMADPVQHWVDIAYNELVCEHGYRFEGRGHAVRSGANGNQTLNAQHYAICALLGSTGSTTPTDAQLQGLRDAIEDYQHNAAAGSEIKGHRDGYSTDCPGGPLYTWVQAGAPRPQEDDMPFTEQQIRQFIREEASGQVVRDANAYAVFWWLTAALTGNLPAGATGDWQTMLQTAHDNMNAESVAAAVWNHPVPDWGLDSQGNAVALGTSKSVFWHAVWGDVDAAKQQAMGEKILAAQSAAIAALAAQITAQHPSVDTAAVVAAVQQAIASATVHVKVDVAGAPAPGNGQVAS
ncbi:GH25 family lysozyme [Kitasatospora sp. NPDC101157]|uniref:GH25 family lysozyme n=1 Tax=Kitasatospora sp. NPDC101157 TaxID=3364098 RepID=UPI0038178665